MRRRTPEEPKIDWTAHEDVPENLRGIVRRVHRDANGYLQKYARRRNGLDQMEIDLSFPASHGNRPSMEYFDEATPNRDYFATLRLARLAGRAVFQLFPRRDATVTETDMGRPISNSDTFDRPAEAEPEHFEGLQLSFDEHGFSDLEALQDGNWTPLLEARHPALVPEETGARIGSGCLTLALRCVESIGAALNITKPR